MDLTRRELVGAGLGGLAALLGAPGCAPAVTNSMPPHAALASFPVGVQLWSIEAEMKRDVRSALAAIRRIGYEDVETASLHGLGVDAFRRALDDAGLRCRAAHVSMGDLMQDTQGAIAKVRDLGATYLVCSSPQPDAPLRNGLAWATAMAQAMTPDAWKRNADRLNAVAVAAKAAGVRTAYHNHAFEFARGNGASGWELLLERTDPTLVGFELDCAWAVAGGFDPAALIRQLGGRIHLLHLKDLVRMPTMGAAADANATCAVGSGVIDWTSVLQAAAGAGIVAGFVEQEPPVREIYAELAKSREYLARLMVR
jgi:sugar phosphate isomerase/epimerase